jgi:cation:H+ antiporter
MGSDLAIALAIFLGSAITVVFLGSQLAKYGDALAALTGWGRLFVGSILLALATSLPELSANVSAVSLDPPNPELAMGNVLGANMVNMFAMAWVALVFGGKRFLQRIAPEQGYLILLAALMTGLAVLFAAIKLEVALWNVGLSSVVLLIVFVAGMRIVYVKRPQGEGDEGEADLSMTLRRASLMFALVSAGVIVAGYFLAFSVDWIAELTGVASSTLGILAVSLVTSILFYADPFYRQGIVVNHSEPAHFVAGGIAIFLILFGLALIMARHQLHRVLAVGGLALMASIYILGAIVVARLGAPETGAADLTANLQSRNQQRPYL